MLARVNLPLCPSRRVHVKNRKLTLPNNTQTELSLPAAVGALPIPVEAIPGTFVVITEPEGIGFPPAMQLGHGHIQPSVRYYLHSSETPAGQWHGLSDISTALRGHWGREPGLWTAFTSEPEFKLRQVLRSYAFLGDNWDGNGAKAPSQEAVNDALTFLSGRPDDIPLPYPEEGADGDVGVYWDNKHTQVFAEVSFEGDGTCAYFAVKGVPGAVIEKCGDDDLKVANPWPPDLLRILRKQDSV